MIIFRQAVKRIIQNKLRLIVLMIIPALFIILFAMQNETSLSIGVVDNDQTILSNKLIEGIKNIYEVKVKILDEKAVFDKTVSYQTDYSIIIEPGFEEKLMAGKNPEIKEFYIAEKEKLFYARMYIENYIYNMKLIANGVGFDKDGFSNALKKYDDGSLSVKNESGTGKKMPQSRAAMGFLIQFMLYMSVITAGLVLEDKGSGVFYRVFYAPVTLKRYFTENLAAFLIVGILQVSVVLVLVKSIGLELGNSPLSMYILLIVFSLVCISLGIWLVSLFKKPLHAYLAIILVTTPLVMLGGCYWPKEFMPDTINKIALFLPTTWVMQGVDKFLYNGKNIMDALLEVLVLLIFSGIFMAAGLLRKVDISK